MLVQWKDDIQRDDSYWEHLRCMEDVLIEDCIRENLKVVEEFINDDATKVKIDNK